MNCATAGFSHPTIGVALLGRKVSDNVVVVVVVVAVGVGVGVVVVVFIVVGLTNCV